MQIRIKGNDVFKNALFRLHDIRDLKIILHRGDIASASGPKRKLLSNTKISSVRSNVIWIPSNPIAIKNSASAVDTQKSQRHVVFSTSNQASPKKGS